MLILSHGQDYHKLDNGAGEWPTDERFPGEFLSWKSVPEKFDVEELLEYNVKFFAAQKHKADWANEVSGYRVTGKHNVIFKRPVRDGGVKSIRKLKYANRVYGTKKRVVVSDKVSELSAVCVDEPADIEPKDEELDPVDGFMKLSSTSPMCTDIVDLVFDNAIYKVSELYKKDLEILRLQKLLSLEKIDSKRKVKEACDLGKANLEEMAVRCEFFHKTILATIHAELQRASKVSSVEAMQQLQQSEFFKKSMKDITDLAKVSVPKT